MSRDFSPAGGPGSAPGPASDASVDPTPTPAEAARPAVADDELFGILAEFADPESLVAAASQVQGAGYRRFEAYSPLPIEGLAEAVGFHRTRLPLVVLIGGILGGSGGYLLQWWASTIAYPLNVGGRPLHSWPAFLPVTFETTVLAAALAGVLGMLALNGLPRPHHPLFAIPRFAHASRDAFFLCILASDRQFDPPAVREFLQSLRPVEITDVPK